MAQQNQSISLQHRQHTINQLLEFGLTRIEAVDIEQQIFNDSPSLLHYQHFVQITFNDIHNRLTAQNFDNQQQTHLLFEPPPQQEYHHPQQQQQQQQQYQPGHGEESEPYGFVHFPAPQDFNGPPQQQYPYPIRPQLRQPIPQPGQPSSSRAQPNVYLVNPVASSQHGYQHYQQQPHPQQLPRPSNQQWKNQQVVQPPLPPPNVVLTQVPLPVPKQTQRPRTQPKASPATPRTPKTPNRKQSESEPSPNVRNPNKRAESSELVEVKKKLKDLLVYKEQLDSFLSSINKYGLPAYLPQNQFEKLKKVYNIIVNQDSSLVNLTTLKSIEKNIESLLNVIASETSPEIVTEKFRQSLTSLKIQFPNVDDYQMATKLTFQHLPSTDALLDLGDEWQSKMPKLQSCNDNWAGFNFGDGPSNEFQDLTKLCKSELFSLSEKYKILRNKTNDANSPTEDRSVFSVTLEPTAPNLVSHGIPEVTMVVPVNYPDMNVGEEPNLLLSSPLFDLVPRFETIKQRYLSLLSGNKQASSSLVQLVNLFEAAALRHVI